MDLALHDKTVIVGGASRGIGRAIAETFLSEGAHVTITGRDQAALSDVASLDKERCQTVAGDLASDKVVDRVVSATLDRWSSIDCVVANVGSGKGTSGWKLEASEWERLFQTNFWTSVKLVEATLPHMIAAGSGSIAMIGSIAGTESIGAPIAYAVAKSAVASYSKNLARTVARSGVRVNCVAPGNVIFDSGTWDRKLRADEDGVRSYIDREVPMNRFATPQEIADVVVFLCSCRASFITGTCVIADGGQTRGGFG